MEGLRKLLDWEWYSDTAMVRLLVHLLLKANTEDKRWLGMTIKRGQLVTSWATLHDETKMSIWTLRRCVANMINTGEITKEPAKGMTLITVCNYDVYQEQPTDTSQDTRQGTRQDTRQGLEKQEKKEKNQKNKKEEKEIIVDDARAREKVWFDEFLNSTIQIQAVCMQTGVSEGDFRARAREVWAEWGLTGVTHDSETDFKKHLLSTIRIKLNNGTTNANQRNYADDRQAEREQLARSYAATIARRLAEDNERASGLRGPDEIPF